MSSYVTPKKSINNKNVYDTPKKLNSTKPRCILFEPLLVFDFKTMMQSKKDKTNETPRHYST
jgi:hypothetical protein